MRQNAIVIPIVAVRRIVVGLLILIVVLTVLIVARQNLWRVGLGDLIEPGLVSKVDRSTYQAVFLTGGQVFFGKADALGDGYLALSDVFYLSSPSEQQASQLIKRGNELHGPTEPMIIPVSQVLFLENLRPNSDVVTAIGKFHAGLLPLATPPAASIAPTTTPSATLRPSPSR